jgi:hypothetical protein
MAAADLARVKDLVEARAGQAWSRRPEAAA